MNSISVKMSHVITIIIVLALLAGSYFGVKSLYGTNIANANAKSYDDREENISTEIEEKLQKGEKKVLEDDDLIITGTEIDVSGKTFEQVKKEMREYAKKNGGIIGK